MSDSLVVKSTTLKLGTKPVGIAARKAAAEAKALAEGKVTPPKLKTPSDCQDRIGIVFDDSGSMDGSKIKDAKAGVIEFLRSCKPNETAVSVFCMGDESRRFNLTSDLIMLAQLVEGIDTYSATPLLETTLLMQKNSLYTRIIVFSDGQPSDNEESLYNKIVTHAKETKVPIDTVFIGTGGGEFMRRLAKDTGGIFLKFDPAKSNFRTAFKYLSPGYRAMLADKSFVEKLENGGV